LCAAILDRRDTIPAPPFSTAVNNRLPKHPRQDRWVMEQRFAGGFVVLDVLSE
jgi:hypothetical protein